MSWARAAAIGMLAVVAIGAFGAHALESRIDSERMEVFRTAVRYHAWHALGLFGIAWGWERYPGRRMRWAGFLLVAGIVLFSGSLYLLAVTGMRWLGAVTPFGGVAWLAAWGLFAAAAVPRRRRDRTPDNL